MVVPQGGPTMRAFAVPSSTVGSLVPQAHISTALPRSAEECYALFCEIERIPEWLTIVRSALVTRRDERRRAREVAFLARLERATVGYTCHYKYQPTARRVEWSTAPDASIRISGHAQFGSLGTRACLMTYHLDLDLGDAGLPVWSDPMFEGHAASASLSDFRDFVLRAL
jgi:ribosome-associated toxin RatA of RatAB toxin-antitoxin module